jgi:L-ascorbate metabolism protein UlaG (beta-lactamase superfamily)
MHKLIIVFLIILTSCSSKKYMESPNWKNGKFKNLESFEKKSFGTFLKWRFNREDKKPWPKYKDYPFEKKPTTLNKKGIKYSVINHATTLIQVDGINILTDPIWSERTSPVSWAGPRRVRNPGIKFEDLPPIDLVVISHNHYDHLDLPTLKNLHKLDKPIILVGLGNKSLLNSEGIKNVVEMDWWDTHNINDKMKATFVPAQHWSARGLFDRFKTLWGGFMLSTSKGHIYFAGDTGYGSFFKTLKKKFSPIKLSFLPIGAYKPRWFMRSAHMSPEDAVLAHIDLGSKHSVAIHFGTFALADDAYDDPLKDLKSAIKKHKLAKESFLIPKFGVIKSLK